MGRGVDDEKSEEEIIDTIVIFQSNEGEDARFGIDVEWLRKLSIASRISWARNWKIWILQM